MTATVTRVSPNPQRPVSEADAALIREAMAANDAAYAALRERVVAAHRDNNAGIRALAKLTGMSTNTIVRWNAESQA